MQRSNRQKHLNALNALVSSNQNTVWLANVWNTLHWWSGRG